MGLGGYLVGDAISSNDTASSYQQAGTNSIGVSDQTARSDLATAQDNADRVLPLATTGASALTAGVAFSIAAVTELVRRSKK